ncbi:hypothetical protein OF83DRAFT_1113623 [Amylostereum chailletii]|nr:hypothetical protein OF83DRAFT_1113623 [Amylostereum chailletii]
MDLEVIEDLGQAPSEMHARHPSTTPAARSFPDWRTSRWSSAANECLEDMDRLIDAGQADMRFRSAAIQDMRYLRQIVFALKSRLNPCLPISRIPPEIMQKIFIHLASTVSMGPSFYIGHGWISITAVCRRWRHIAIDIPSIWAHEVCSVPAGAAAEEWLRRAQACPLGFKFTADEAEKQAFVLKHIHRGRRIVYCYPGYSDPVSLRAPFLTLARGLTKKPLPILEDLSIESSRAVPRVSSTLTVPRLKRIFLVDMFVPWSSSSLTELTLVRHNTPKDHFPSAKQLFRLLQASPLLEKLHLTWIPDFNSLPADRRLQLSHLRAMELEGTSEILAAFWGRLVLPPTVGVIIHVNAEEVRSQVTTTETARVVAALKTHIHDRNLIRSFFVRNDVDECHLSFNFYLVSDDPYEDFAPVPLYALSLHDVPEFDMAYIPRSSLILKFDHVDNDRKYTPVMIHVMHEQLDISTTEVLHIAPGYNKSTPEEWQAEFQVFFEAQSPAYLRWNQFRLGR